MKCNVFLGSTLQVKFDAFAGMLCRVRFRSMHNLSMCLMFTNMTALGQIYWFQCMQQEVRWAANNIHCHVFCFGLDRKPCDNGSSIMSHAMCNVATRCSCH